MTASSLSSLPQWLERISSVHPKAMDLGLERVASVAENAALASAFCPIITIAGTNGKGSVAAFLESIYTTAGYRVGCYTSPHIMRFNERMRVKGKALSDADIVAAMQRIENARGKLTLTYFEFATLSAMAAFQAAGVDLVILEVGLGGRLDAVNLWDADVSVITNIALDHEAWLGNTRDAIAFEKVAIARANRPLVVGDPDPPHELLSQACKIRARLRCIHRDFDYSLQGDTWLIDTGERVIAEIPCPALAGHWQYANASTAIVACEQLRSGFPVTDDVYRRGIARASNPGRFQRTHCCGHPVILDVGHNPAAVQALGRELERLYPQGVNIVFAVMQDKAVTQMVEILSRYVKNWFLAPLEIERAMTVDKLAEVIVATTSMQTVNRQPNLRLALDAAISDARRENMRPVLVCGSFYTVAEVAEYVN